MVHATLEQARLVADLFIGRSSDYALQLSTGRYRRVGLPISLEVVREHLRGSCTLGTYLLDEHSACCFAVFDADQPDGLAVLAAVRRRLAADGIPSYLEASRRGGHLWVFFEAPAPAWAARRWLLPYCPAGVEFYPKQDESAAVGSLIRVPLGIHRRSGQRYPFVVWQRGQFVPVAADLAGMLSALKAVRRVAVSPALLPAGPTSDEQTTPPTSQALRHLATPAGYPPHPTIADWCAEQDPFALIGRYVHLDSRGMGHCPFGEHHVGGRDTHASFQVFRPKRPGGTCWRCYTGNISGDVFNFLQLYSGMDAGKLWTRLRRGEVL